MTHVVCGIALAKGRWNYPPSPRRVRRKLRHVFDDWLLAVDFHEPAEGNAVEVEIGLDGDEEDCDWICDAIIKVFLEWKPEYESMIEVEIVCAPAEPTNQFAYVQDEWDDWDDFDRIERVWH